MAGVWSERREKQFKDQVKISVQLVEKYGAVYYRNRLKDKNLVFAEMIVESVSRYGRQEVLNALDGNGPAVSDLQKLMSVELQSCQVDAVIKKHCEIMSNSAQPMCIAEFLSRIITDLEALGKGLASGNLVSRGLMETGESLHTYLYRVLVRVVGFDVMSSSGRFYEKYKSS